MLESYANISILLSGVGEAYTSERALLRAWELNRRNAIE